MTVIKGWRNDAAAAQQATNLNPVPVACDSAGRIMLAPGAAGSITSAGTFLHAQVAAAGIGAAYAAALTDAHYKLDMKIDNQTDKSVYVSLDGGTTDHCLLSPYQALALPLGSYGRHHAANIDLKQGPDGAPSTGVVDILAVY